MISWAVEPPMKALLAAAVAGVALCAAMPLGEIAPLVWVALVPLLVAVRAKGFLWGFIGGLAAVFIAAQVSISGLLYAVKGAEGEPAWIYTGFGLFGFSVAIALGIWAEKGTKDKPAWWFAAIATLLEAALLFQLPAHLALALYRSPAAMGVANVGGVWLVSFFVWWANFAIADRWLSVERKRIGLILVPMAAFAVPWLGAPAGSAEVVAQQTTIEDFDALEADYRKANESGTRLVVWPEFGGIPYVNQGDPSKLVALASEGTPLVTSFPAPGDQALPYNYASLVTREGESARYAKRRPFGQESKMHAAGRAPVAVPWNGAKLGLNICFDSCYPKLIRETAALEGVQLIALPTIDPPAPHGFLAAMHAAFTPFRAAENGVPIVRADGNAYSQIVAANGQILGEARPGREILRGKVNLENKATLAERIGEGWLFVAGALLLVGLRNANKK